MTSTPDRFSIRDASPSDVAAMVALSDLSDFAARWSADHYARILEPTTDASVCALALVAECSPAVPKQNSSLAGLLIARGIESEWELENLVVGVSVQRQGLGEALMREFISRVRRNEGKAIFLEVRAANSPARALYEKLGFRGSGERRDYYRHPPDNAILYRMDFL